jgi:hypothetical protein
VTDLIDKLERDVLSMLLTGDDPVLAVLRAQRELSSITRREMTGVGFSTTIDVCEDAPALHGYPSFVISDVFADVEGLHNGASFLLFIKNGVLAMLEGFTFDEPWPSPVIRYSLKYLPQRERDIASLRKLSGWPSALS